MRITTCLAMAALAVAGCSKPMINIRYMRPPQRNIPESVRKLGIVATASDGAQLHDKAAADRILSLFESAIIQNNHYALVARNELDSLLMEHHLNMADFAAGTGGGLKIEGVDALLIAVVGTAAAEENVGPITVLVEETRRDKVQKTRKKPDGTDETYMDDGPPYTVLVPTDLKNGRYVIVDFNATFKLIDTRRGFVYASLPFRADYDSRNAVKHLGNNYAIPPSQLPEPRSKLSRLMETSVAPFMQQIAPYEIQRKVMLLANSDASKRGVDMASRGLVPEAKEAFLQAQSIEVPNDGALYDYGVMLEIEGDFTQAYEFYKRAYAVRDRNLYIEAMQRVKEEMLIAGR